MGVWATVWKTTFFVVLPIFVGMAVWVTIWGARDIKRLLENIDEGRDGGEA